MAFANGLIPLDQMTRLSVGYGYLLPAAAQNFESWRSAGRAAGWNLTITSAADAFRTYAIQERIFRERYTTTYLVGRPTKRWNGVTYWLRPGQATAAVPGTSNHGRGLAVDIKDAGGFNGAFYKWMASTGPSFGWSNTEGKAINEPWHWVNDNVARGAIGSIADAVPDAEEDDMFSDSDRAVMAAIEEKLTFSYGVPWFKAIDNKLNSLADSLAAVLAAAKQADASVTNVNRNMIDYLQVPGQDFGYPAASHNAIGALVAEMGALRSVLASVSAGDGLSHDELVALAETAAKKAVEGLEGTIDFKVK